MTGTNKTARALLAAYFRHQRELGTEDMHFESGAAVRAILGGGRQAAGAPSSGGSSAVHGHTRGDGELRYARQNTPANQGDGAPLTGLSRLEKIRTVDALDTGEFKRAPPRRSQFVPPPRPIQPAKINTPKREKLAEYYRAVSVCGDCAAARGRTKVVFGSGSADGRLFIIGDVPSASDDAAGLPFTGAVGELLDKILVKMGINRGADTFITYLQKCRGGGFDREHATACRARLDRQIEIIQPKAILVFGRPAANVIWKNEDDIESMRGAKHIYKDTTAVVTYDLSLLLTEARYRYGAWDDMKTITEVL